MILYQYRCQECGHEFDVKHEMNDKTEQRCPLPECGYTAAKVMGGTAVVFKGAGFYCNQYPKKDKCESNRDRKNREVKG